MTNAVKLSIDDARAIALHVGFAPSDVDRASAPALAAMLSNFAANHAPVTR